MIAGCEANLISAIGVVYDRDYSDQWFELEREMPIDLDDFADECVDSGDYIGVNSHYLIAAGRLRSMAILGESATSDAAVADKTGPYAITQTIWDADPDAADFNLKQLVFSPQDIKLWRVQCLFAAVSALRAQNAAIARSGAFPSAIDLYREQFPDDAARPADDLQAALDATANLVAPAEQRVLDAALPISSILADADAAATPRPSVPTIDPAAPHPRPRKSEEVFVAKSPWIMAKLMDDFDLTAFQAAGVLGNIGHECAGFRTMQEVNPKSGRGGFGWCQWTRDRRVNFERHCASNGLSPASDEANYHFLKLELSTRPSYADSIAELKKAATLSDSVRFFEKKFEKAGVKAYNRRDRWATLALDPFKKLLPSDVSRLIDPDAQYGIVAQAKAGDARYWVVDEFSESGGQALIRRSGDGSADVLLRDTMIFPLPAAIIQTITRPVADALARDVELGVSPPQPQPRPPGADHSALLLASARACDGGNLVTRNVPGTSGGRRACAWAVNEVARRALGHPIGGGLSTASMLDVLVAKHTETPRGGLVGGLVIISPTAKGRVGHVGIVGDVANAVGATRIYSNSSRRKQWHHLFTLASWESYYLSMGLRVRFFKIA